MRKIIFSFLIATIFISCNNSHKKNSENKMPVEADSTQKLPDSLLKQISPMYTQIDPRVSASFSAFVKDYIELKNALVNDDGNAASTAGSSMATKIKNFDIALLDQGQRNFYNSFADDLKENAEHISESAKDIGHQREHFTMLSDEVYQLVKGFGGGRNLYVDNCRMANENKGAIWLSEFKEIKNPYFAGGMTECVKIEGIAK
jgi:uncharacterized protein DUF3347